MLALFTLQRVLQPILQPIRAFVVVTLPGLVWSVLRTLGF